MCNIPAWIKKHRRSKPKPTPKTKFQAEMPFLPSSRCSVDMSSTDTPSGPFFQLPFEIRSMIYAFAFGGDALHIDLVQEKVAWQWKGCMCRRNPPDIPPSMRYHWRGPWLDTCIKGKERAYRLQLEGQHPLGCFLTEDGKKLTTYLNIGIMGFLLSCRQAYTEGIEFLYSSISIKSEPLLLHLPKLIPPNRLATITSLEFVIDAHSKGPYNTRKPVFVPYTLPPILDNIAAHCHRLRSLCISVTIKNSSRIEDILDVLVLIWIDKFYRTKPLRNMRVELPFYNYKNIYAGTLWDGDLGFKEIKNPDHPSEKPKLTYDERSYWRCLNGETATMQSRLHERYPYPPLKWPVMDGEAMNVESKGYWLRGGFEGNGPMICTMATGFPPGSSYFSG
ncbi:hypothetical protein M011DRAFT_224153 [Sporormia fimetaria CBS 119925]|uniref:DUF7730 domain-containing protein n=1 Tax=Sporormia fimetaria CBS 119925 TaxID=1340428 RepID=A0A6A6V274_9PLEO|nr:hypothetical protein M011DRAFT_224153 [Sporormia fimetaria CBS 119925]